MKPDEITIAVTVYDRRRFIKQAIESALNQRIKPTPRVVIVEDCGPDPALRDYVLRAYGDRVLYHRNESRHGLCGNWNVCIDLCRTPWLCILHDDDMLDPGFTDSMIELSEAAPQRGLYFGECEVIDERGRTLAQPVAQPFSWRELNLEYWTYFDPVCFPGQLFRVDAARSVGGFRASSVYAADWEMWFKLTLRWGSAATNRRIAIYREHRSAGRGTVAADMSGRRYAYVNVQRKRHAAWLTLQRPSFKFDRRRIQRDSPIPMRFLLQNGYVSSDRMLRYNASLLFASSPPHLLYRLFQAFVRVFTWRSLRWISWLVHWMPSRHLANPKI